ncbi:MAG: nickel-dependent hydrogenase large subunit [Desulfobacterales bacterium]|nr:nickel-dependent hydrogenase large subunit [Desulfobacterales bacterium]
MPPEANLMAVAHYLEALRLAAPRPRRMHAIFGGKNPHPQHLVVRRRHLRQRPHRRPDRRVPVHHQGDPGLHQERLHPRSAGGGLVLQGLGRDRRHRPTSSPGATSR